MSRRRRSGGGRAHGRRGRGGGLDLTVGKRFLYLFDFGDNNMFNVDVMDIRPAGPADNGSFPRLVGSKGKAPEQYPDMDW